MASYDEIIDEAAEGFLGFLGEDDLADIWGPAVDMKLTDDNVDLPMVVYHEVYADILRRALAKQEATVALLKGTSRD